MRDAIEDLRVRWHYHPTFSTRVLGFGVGGLMLTLLGYLFIAYITMTPACQRSFWDAANPPDANQDAATSAALDRACEASNQ